MDAGYPKTAIYPARTRIRFCDHYILVASHRGNRDEK